MYSRSPIERRFPADVTRRPKPYVMFGGTAGGRLEHEKDVLNHLGYRGRTPSPEKNPGEFRVFALGGSALVNGNPPLPVLLEEEFRRNGYDNVNVYNFGVVSSVSGMEVSRIYAEIAGFHPDLILMYNGSNDIYTPLQADPRPGYPFNFIVYENNPLLESDVREYPVIPLLLYGSTLCRNLFSSYFLKKFVPLQAVREEAGYLSGEWKKAIADTYVRNLVKAHKLSKAFGAEFIAFVQPALPLRKDPPEEEKKYAGPAAMRHYVDVYEMVSAGIESVKRDEGVKIFDLGGLYDGRDGRVFYDICHTYQEEKPAAAKALYEHIVAAINIPCMNEKQEGASRFSGHSVNGNTCP
jgi:hypothetical protein